MSGPSEVIAVEIVAGLSWLPVSSPDAVPAWVAHINMPTGMPASEISMSTWRPVGDGVWRPISDQIPTAQTDDLEIPEFLRRCPKRPASARARAEAISAHRMELDYVA